MFHVKHLQNATLFVTWTNYQQSFPRVRPCIVENLSKSSKLLKTLDFIGVFGFFCVKFVVYYTEIIAFFSLLNFRGVENFLFLCDSFRQYFTRCSFNNFDINIYRFNTIVSRETIKNCTVGFYDVSRETFRLSLNSIPLYSRSVFIIFCVSRETK